MARKPMVTRTIKQTNCTVLSLNITTGEACNQTVALAGTFKDEKKLLKAVQDACTTDDVKPVHIVDKVEEDVLYGMSEADFIAHATKLDPATRKLLEAESSEPVEQ